MNFFNKVMLLFIGKGIVSEKAIEHMAIYVPGEYASVSSNSASKLNRNLALALAYEAYYRTKSNSDDGIVRFREFYYNTDQVVLEVFNLVQGSRRSDGGRVEQILAIHGWPGSMNRGQAKRDGPVEGDIV